MTWVRDRAQLPRRAQRMIKIRETETVDLLARARRVLAAVATAPDLQRAQRLARLAIVGLEAGTRECAWLHDAIDKPGINGVCLQCSRPYNGTAECNLAIYEAMCPRRYGDFADGIVPVAYAEFSTSVKALG